jgi:hypothetical protein
MFDVAGRGESCKMQAARLTTAQNVMWVIHCLTDWIIGQQLGLIN